MIRLSNGIVILCTLVVLIGCQQEQHHQQQTIYTIQQKWGFGILTGICLSLVGFLAAIIIILLNCQFVQKFFKLLIKFLIAFASAALIGDAMIHIISVSYKLKETNSNIVSLLIMSGLLTFIVLGKILDVIGLSHNHGQSIKEQHKQIKKQNIQNKIILPEPIVNINNIQSTQDIKQIDQKQKGCMQNLIGKQKQGYLNLLSSLLHNFIDGLVIGIGFSTGKKSVVVPLIIAVFAHQIPRQLADVGILIQSKFSKIQTILCNGIINLISVLGVIIGLSIVNVSQVNKYYTLCFIAGTFIHIAASLWNTLFKQKQNIFHFIQFLGLITGGGIMYLILLAQNQSHQNQH